MKCSSCQHETIDTRAKWPLVFGLPFRCRNCRAIYHITEESIGRVNYLKYIFFGGLSYLLVAASAFNQSILPLIVAIGSMMIVLHVLPVALDNSGRSIAWLSVRGGVTVLALVAFIVSSLSMGNAERTGSRLAKDYLTESPIIKKRVGRVLDVQLDERRRGVKTSDFHLVEGRHIFRVTGELGAERIGVVWVIARESKPAFRVTELWLIHPSDRIEKIWPLWGHSTPPQRRSF